MDADERPTEKHIQPYEYRLYPGNRVQIVHLGAKLMLHKSEIQRKLSGEDHPLRDLSAHERIMLEKAWEVLNELRT